MTAPTPVSRALAMASDMAVWLTTWPSPCLPSTVAVPAVSLSTTGSTAGSSSPRCIRSM